ncbi:MAG: radical SAM protein [Alphaproteobacteria bacterium]|nr:radical SAM protein [Alphaproteobacteria bacterium]
MSIIQNSFNNFADNILPVGGFVRRLPYIIVFKATHWCWYNCPHCCENAGPHRPREFMPEQVIKYYTDQANQDPQFSKSIVLTGGEIMSAYKFGPKDYVPNIMKHIMDKNIGLDIKTNGAWVRTNLREQIIDDFTDMAQKYQKWVSLFQISLSMDKYHPNALENNIQIIRELAKSKNDRIMLHISGFNDQIDVMNDFEEKLKQDKELKVEFLQMLSTNSAPIPVIVINDGAVILQTSTNAQLFNGGRAANLTNAKKIEYPQFSFANSDGCLLMAFDTMGNVTLGENSGRKIHARWRDKQGNPRPLKDIRRDLVKNAQYEEIRQILIDTKNSFLR